MRSFDYDLFVIGGGSGGVRAGRLAAAMGKKVAIAEEFRFGGTCVIRGCVPKKLYVYASQYSEHFEDARGFGWSIANTSFDWEKLRAAKGREISRLEGLYQQGLANAGAEILHTRAELVGPNAVKLADTDEIVTAERILVAAGGRAMWPDHLAGVEHCITSNEAFDLPELPKAILIVGGGYIAVEFANIFHGLGVETTLIYRGAEILSRFDHDMRRGLHTTMKNKGIRIICQDNLKSVERGANGRLVVETVNHGTLTVDQTMLALGRVPHTTGLGLEAAGVKTNERGAIIVDKFSRTSSPSIWAIGDVTDRIQLTPVAIHEAMCFIQTEFKQAPVSPDHDAIATAVFSQPEIGSVGCTEDDAAKQFSVLEVYRAEFRPMKATLSGRNEKTVMKLIVNALDRKVVGAHVLGHEAGELAQLIGITLKAGCRKEDFDRTMAVHPTASEELVTMYAPTYRIKNGVRVA